MSDLQNDCDFLENKAKLMCGSDFKREKGRDLTRFYDKSPYTHRKSKKQRDNTKRHQNFDYTTITDRLRTVSWGNDSH